MATFTVNTTDDIVDGNLSQLSLREAVAQSNATAAADTIAFASTIQGQTLTLTGGELTLSRDVTINGHVALSGGYLEFEGDPIQGSRIFNIVGGETDVKLNNLSLFDGYAGQGSGERGGGILLGGGSLVLQGCRIDNCIAGRDFDPGSGGGVYATAGSRLTILSSSISNNNANGGDFGGYGGDYGGRAELAGIGGGIATGDNVTLLVRDSDMRGNTADGIDYVGAGGAIFLGEGGSLTIEDTNISDGDATRGGGLEIHGTAHIARSIISDNSVFNGGAIWLDGRMELVDSTIHNNQATLHIGFGGYGYFNGGYGGAINARGELIVRNSTITGNRSVGDYDSHSDNNEYIPGSGGGIWGTSLKLEIFNSIVAGNSAGIAPDIFGAITTSNAHNVFGSDVTGNATGDRESTAGSTLFAIGTPNSDGVVLLRNSTTNPALGAADTFAAMSADQIGATRPQPSGTLSDIGAAELNRTLSTTPSVNNDALSGTSSANTISGLAGNDRIYGQAGNDTLNGDDGSDTFDGGTGNDKINGGTGVDTVRYDGSTAVRVDISGSTDTAKRGTATDTLTGIEAFVGSSANDTLIGDGGRNWFLGQGGKDTQTGRGGVDLFDFNAVADSGVGSTLRDVIADFTHLTDKIDLSAIDADSGVGRDQAFRWVGASALTGAGQVGFFTSSGNTIIRGSNDADAATEFEIQLTGIKTLTEVDFYL